MTGLKWNNRLVKKRTSLHVKTKLNHTLLHFAFPRRFYKRTTILFMPLYWYCQNRSLSRQATGIYFYQDRSLVYILALKVYVLLKTHNSGVRNASFHLVKWQGLLPRSYMQYTSQILPSLLQKLILTKLQGQGNTTDW